MIRFYSAKVAGPYHIEKGLPCQDAFCVKQISDNCIVAAVCDGLGSMSRSDIGSDITANTAVEHVAANYKSGLAFNDIKKIMNNAFVYAFKAVLERANADDEDSDEYDTTICLAIYDSGKVYYGQSGDSGLVCLMRDGHYLPVTEQQRDEDGSVFPLCFGPDKWEFGEVEGEASALMLMTDGVLENVCHPLLSHLEVKVNVPLARRFMDRHEDMDEEVAAVQAAAHKYLENFPEAALDDDKTVVVIYDTEHPARVLEDDYYKAPDWDAIYKQAEKEFYASDEEELPAEDDNTCSHDTPVTEATAVDDITQAEIDALLPSPDTPVKAPVDEAASNKPAANKAEKDDEDDDSSSPDDKPPDLGGKKRRKHLRFFVNAIAMSFLLAFSVGAFLASDLVREHTTISFIGVFITCFIANASVLLPSPSILLALEYSLLINPVLVALCAAFGSSLGEMTGFLMGYSGRELVNSDNKFLRFIEAKFSKHQYLLIFIISGLPLPIFDVIGLLSGAAKVNPIKFYIACFAGKLIKMLTFVGALHLIVSNI